eukprot:Pgem_evm1s4050
MNYSKENMNISDNSLLSFSQDSLIPINQDQQQQQQQHGDDKATLLDDFDNFDQAELNQNNNNDNDKKTNDKNISSIIQGNNSNDDSINITTRPSPSPTGREDIVFPPPLNLETPSATLTSTSTTNLLNPTTDITTTTTTSATTGLQDISFLPILSLEIIATTTTTTTTITTTELEDIAFPPSLSLEVITQTTTIATTTSLPPSICDTCHSHAVCINSDSCECKGDLVGDGVNTCQCPSGYNQLQDNTCVLVPCATGMKRIEGSSQCVPVSTFNFNIPSDFDKNAHVKLSANSDPYEIFESKPFKNDIEESDKHKGVKHVTNQFDETLNKHVINVVMHRDQDGDGASGKSDRQRTEMKASGSSDDDILSLKDDTMIYMWWFKVNNDLKASNNFFHIFQVKLVGDDIDGMPMLTFTPKRNSNDNNKDHFYFVDLNEYHSMGRMDNFKGKWVQAKVEIKFSKTSGYTKIDLRDIEGRSLLPNKKEINLTNQNRWEGYEGNTPEFARPKFGIYRSLKSKEYYNKEDD